MGLLENALGVLAPPFCWACGGAALAHEPLCPRCRRELRWRGADAYPLEGVEVWAPVTYEGPARALVRGLKFRGAKGLAEPLAAQIVANAPPRLLEAPAALVPVPLHPARARRRGYNQAALLARAVAARTELEVADCLLRGGRAGARQMGRGRAQRLLGIEGSVRARPGLRPPRDVVLVDDVATTGATLRACAVALREAGAARVAAVAYAVTPGR